MSRENKKMRRATLCRLGKILNIVEEPLWKLKIIPTILVSFLNPLYIGIFEYGLMNASVVIVLNAYETMK